MQKRKPIKKIFRPGERVMLKLDRTPDKYRNKVAIVQDPPYIVSRSQHRLPYLSIKWEDGTDMRWLWPGSYFKRIPVPRRSIMPDTRSYLDILTSL
jgi:hypothetical protein